MFSFSASAVILFILIFTQLFLSNVRGFDFVNTNRKLFYKCVFIFLISCSVVLLFNHKSVIEYLKEIVLASSVFIYFIFSLLLKKFSQKFQNTDFSIEIRPRYESYFGDDKGYTYLDNILTSIIMLGSAFIPILFYYLLFGL